MKVKGLHKLYHSEQKYDGHDQNEHARILMHLDRTWVANNDGLRVFLVDGTKLFYTKENSGLPDEYITALAEDQQGNIYIGTRTKGVVVIHQNGEWSTYQADGTTNGLVENWVTAIFIDHQDRVWIGTRRGGISMLSPDGLWTTYNTYLYGVQSDPLYDDKEVNAFAMDEQGRVWIGTWDALFALDPEGNWLAYTQANSAFNPDYVRALTVDNNNRLWIATFHEVIVLDLNKPLPKMISNERIRARDMLLTPARIIEDIKWTLFAPAEAFFMYSSGICGVGYLTLLVAVLSIACLWMLAFLMAIFMYRD